MTRPRSQSDSARDKALDLAKQDTSGHDAKPSPSIVLESGNGHTSQIPDESAQPNNGRNKARPKRKIEDHPAWSAYLSQRRILEPAIVADAWIEREEWTGQDVLVWRTRRRDGSPGAARRRLLKRVKTKGKKQAKVRWQYADDKIDEPFYYVGTLDDLKREIARAGGVVYIVEGEFDVWSLHRLGIHNVIGIYGIHNIPRDIAEIFTEVGVGGFVYLADNDTGGDIGASNLRSLLHGREWKGEGEYRKVAGAGIPEKGDVNDLLRHHYPDMAAAHAALEALSRFAPRLKRKKAAKPLAPLDSSQGGWQAVNQAITNDLGLIASDFKPNGFTKQNHHCLNPEHDDKEASAGWSRDGNYFCFHCGKIDSWQVAEWRNIDWRALLKPQPQFVSPKGIDLNAAPGQATATRAPLAFDQTPDTWLRSLIDFYTPTEAALFHYALRFCQTGPLSGGFTRDEFIQGARPLGCNLKADTIKRFFKNEVFKDDNHSIFGKVDPGDRSNIRKCKFRLRELDDIRRRIMHDIHFRIYERTFHKHRDTLIEFKVFDEALPGSKFPNMLQSVLEPLYKEQRQRFESLKHSCEQKIAAYEAELEDLSATPLPDWTIDQPCELPALLARGIYDDDPEDRSKREWVRLLGISKGSVNTVLQRAGIQRRPYIIKEEVNSQREARERARELNAKIIAAEVDGHHQNFDATLDISPQSTMFYQPTAEHTIVSDDKQIVKAAPANPSLAPAGESAKTRATNMEKPGNWTKASWDPQFIYWELVKACCLLHGYEVIENVGILDPQTGEVWTDPTLDDLLGLITGELPAAEPDPG